MNCTSELLTHLNSLWVSPVPAKCHYQFGIHDFSRIIQGITAKTKIKDQRELNGLVLNETLRVLRDRMICEEDKELLTDKMRELYSDQLDTYSFDLNSG